MESIPAGYPCFEHCHNVSIVGQMTWQNNKQHKIEHFTRSKLSILFFS